MNSRAKIGIAIIVVCFIASIYPYMFMFAFPVYLVGAILVWLSNLPTVAKVLWTLLPLALWYPVIYLVYGML